MLPDHMTPELWLDQFLGSSVAMKGGVVRRQIRDVERIVGWAPYLEEVERRGFQAVVNARHVVVFCNRQRIRRVV